ncbi:MAG: nucleotidyltransferase domain-containing protein [bacterium]|nr:nucleotidyltransferase domain-containing protein [Candidatus Limimorpha caballi]
MDYIEIIKMLRKLGEKILPPEARLFLYGSRARGDYNENSDWDLLLLLNRPKQNDDYEKIAYPLIELGFDLGQYFSVHTYSKDEWDRMSSLPFFKNVERDKIALV